MCPIDGREIAEAWRAVPEGCPHFIRLRGSPDAVAAQLARRRATCAHCEEAGAFDTDGGGVACDAAKGRAGCGGCNGVNQGWVSLTAGVCRLGKW